MKEWRYANKMKVIRITQ